MIAKVPIYVLFVGILHWQSSEIIVGYIFIICIQPFEKCVPDILLYWFPHTHTHTNTHTNIYIQFDIPFGEESGKRRNNCRSKTHFNDAQTVILAFLVQMTSASNQLLYMLCSIYFQPSRKLLLSTAYFLRRKWSWKLSDLALPVCLCMILKVFLRAFE